MLDVKTKYMGLELKNPIILDIAMLRLAIELAIRIRA